MLPGLSLDPASKGFLQLREYPSLRLRSLKGWSLETVPTLPSISPLLASEAHVCHLPLVSPGESWQLKLMCRHSR